MKSAIPIVLLFLLPWSLPLALSPLANTAISTLPLQISHGDPAIEYVVEDLKGQLVFVEKETRPQAVGILPIETDAEAVKIKAEDSSRRRVRVEEHPALPNTFLVFGKGKIWIDVMYVDFEEKKWDWDDFVIDLGDGDDPYPPQPDPDDPDDPSNVPEDKFDNLGRRIDAKADALSLSNTVRLQVSEVYSFVAGRMESFDIKTSSDALEIINSRLNLITMTDDAREVLKVAEQDAASRPPLPWNDLITWVRAIAAGMKGD